MLNKLFLALSKWYVLVGIAVPIIGITLMLLAGVIGCPMDTTDNYMTPGQQKQFYSLSEHDRMKLFGQMNALMLDCWKVDDLRHLQFILDCVPALMSAGVAAAGVGFGIDVMVRRRASHGRKA